jgi:mRNA-decapping enzyme 1B
MATINMWILCCFYPRTENLVEDLLTDYDVDVQVPYVMYRNSNAEDEILGIWFYNPQECEEVAHLFKR